MNILDKMGSICTAQYVLAPTPSIQNRRQPPLLSRIPMCGQESSSLSLPMRQLSEAGRPENNRLRLPLFLLSPSLAIRNMREEIFIKQ